MRVLHTGTIEAKAGGVSTSIYLMLTGLLHENIDAELFTYEKSPKDVLLTDKILIHFTKRPANNPLQKMGWTPSYKSDLISIKNVDIYQANGVWLYNTYALVDVAKRMGKPYVIMPHGMLYPQDINKSNTSLKKISLRLRLLKDLNNAACVCATCLEEMEVCRNLGITAPIAVIPNSIDTSCNVRSRKADKSFVLGYIGRISKRKNIEAIIYAWDKLRTKAKTNSYPHDFQQSKLMIVGGGDVEYERFLKAEVKRLDLQNVDFCGFLNGSKKEEALCSFDTLVLPSEFENFGMVIIEGLARGIPCIATYGAPWSDLKDFNAGFWIPYEQAALDEAVEKCFSMNNDLLHDMGRNGRDLVLHKYSIEIISVMFREMYEWILNKTDMPRFIHIMEFDKGRNRLGISRTK